MQQITDWAFVFVFVLGVIGLVVAAILFFRNRAESFSAQLLAAYLFCASIICLNFNLTNTDFFLHFPHLWRVVVWAAFSAPPLAFLYVRSVLEQEFEFRRTDILFFLPALLYTLSMIPFYLTDTEGKLDVVRNFMADKTLISSEPEGMLPLGWGFLLRTGFGLLLAMGQYAMLARWRKRILSGSPVIAQNVATLQWLFFFTVVMSFSYAFLLVETMLHVSRFLDLNRWIILTVSANIFFICTYLLLKPEILYGMTGWLQEGGRNDGMQQKKASSIPQPKRNTLSREQELAYKLSLEKHLRENRPYLRAGYKIEELSKELDIPGYQLSAFINQEYGKNFNELINDRRVEHLEDLLRSSPDNLQYTLEALGKMAGFNSRTAFISAVKKKTGMPPVEYFRHLRLPEKG